MTRGEVGLVVPLVLLCVWIGVAPNPFLDRSNASLEAVVESLDEARATAALEIEHDETARLEDVR